MKHGLSCALIQIGQRYRKDNWVGSLGQMKSKLLVTSIAALMAVCAGVSAHALAQSDSSGLLDTLERGRWQLRSVGSNAASLTVSQLCLGESRYLAW